MKKTNLFIYKQKPIKDKHVKNTSYSQGHAYLYEKYSDLYKKDPMIPHEYSPAQKALLEVVLTPTFTSFSQLKDALTQAASNHTVSETELFQELISNPLLSAWLKDIHQQISA